ncbi:hypothetical protein ACQCP7_25855, partial [Ralstonia pseudosolanacearum]|uniref:hypothetical protein n=1 Tax=Ralstonia pseudosolanacearum TaxID=1310165 RepID=UPI003CFBA69B
MRLLMRGSGIHYDMACRKKAVKLSLLVFSTFSFAVLLSNLNVSSVSAAAKASTLTLGVSTDLLSIDLMPSSSGTFGTSSTSTITAKTDNYTGYTLSISA